MEKRQKIFFIVVASLIIVLIFVAKYSKNTSIEAGKYDQFAICLKDSGAVFYGTWWCPHCKNTKELFGSSKELLPYVECSSPDGSSQLDICKDKKIEGYPTWEFKDGSRLTGEVSLETLRDKTNCELPQ